MTQLATCSCDVLDDCTSLAIQEDMLCDDCRGFRVGRTSSAHYSPHGGGQRRTYVWRP